MSDSLISDLAKVFTGESEMPSVMKAMQTHNATSGSWGIENLEADRNRINKPLIDTFNMRNGCNLKGDSYTCSLGLSNRLQDAGVKFTPSASVVGLRNQFKTVDPNDVEIGDILNYGTHHNVMVTNYARNQAGNVDQVLIQGNETRDSVGTRVGTISKWVDLDEVQAWNGEGDPGFDNVIRKVDYPKKQPNAFTLPLSVATVVGNHTQRFIKEIEHPELTSGRMIRILEEIFWSGGKTDSPLLQRYKYPK